MTELEKYKLAVSKLNQQVDKVPTFDQLQIYFSLAMQLLEDCPTEKKMALELSKYAKGWSQKLCADNTHDKKLYEKYWDMYWNILRWESPYLLDSYCIYIEKNRPPAERFYVPRRNALIKVANIYQKLEDDELDEAFIHQPPRTGKLLADDTPILTDNGWKNHGDLRLGDKVIGSDGKFTTITLIHPKYHTTHKVTMSDGSEIYCHYRHEWTVFDRVSNRWKTLETKEMLEKLQIIEKSGKVRNRYMLPLKPIIQGEEKELHIHPYVFGAWIGDGTTSKPRLSDPECDSAIFDKIIECGYPMKKRYVHNTTGVISAEFENLKQGLNKYGLCNRYDKDNKYIPEDYLHASIEQRLQLLAGLLDTDGTLNKKEHRYQYSTTSEKVKDGIVELINTFGWRVCAVKCAPHTSSYGIVGKKDCYVISFNPTIHIPCVLERKRLFEFSKQRRIAIKSIEKAEHKQGNCITVANLDGIYLAGKNLIPTHNTQMMTLATTWHACRNTELSNLYATYKESLGGAFLDGVTEILTDPTYLHKDVFPKTEIVATDAKAHKLDLGRKKKYTSLSGKGLESGLNGEYDANGWLIIDDIIEGIQDAMNPEILKRKQIIFDNNLMSRKKEGCKVVYNGTIWSLHDIFSNRLEFIKNNDSTKNIRYEILKIPALNDNDESNFNYQYGVGFSTEHYKRERAKFEANEDMASWFAQYQQEPIERDGAVFNPETMSFYNGVLPKDGLVRICSACDVALGGADYLSMPIAYVYEDGSVYIHDVVFNSDGKSVTQPLVVNKIIENDVGSGFFEANQGGEGYKDDIDRLLKDKGKKINLVSKFAPTSKRKEQRIWDKAPRIREFIFRENGCRSPEYRKFMQNLYSFTVNGKNKHDDAPDSLAMLADFIDGSGVSVVKAAHNPFRRY